MRTPRRAALARAATCSAGALVLLLSACTAGGGTTGAQDAPTADQKVSLTVYSAFADRELGILNKVLDGFHAAHPNITINSQGSQDDDKIT